MRKRDRRDPTIQDDSAPLGKGPALLPAGLYIVATPIGNLADMTYRAVDTLKRVNIIACEDTRETGKLAAVYGIRTARLAYHDHNAAAERPRLVARMRAGQAVALVSDAGTPLVSDPGYKLVQAVVDEGLPVTTVPGASACLSALQLSALPTDRFLFAGFLPPKSSARRRVLQEVAGLSATLVFYETGPRLSAMLADVAEVLGPERPVAVAREITKAFEETRRGPAAVLAAQYAAEGAPRGEIAVVVGGAAAGLMAWAEDAVTEALARAMADEGLSLRDAAALVALRAGWRKSDVYGLALSLRRAGDLPS